MYNQSSIINTDGLILCRPMTGRNILLSLHCALASCGVVYCNRSCLWVGVFMGVCMWVCYLEIACTNPHQTGFVHKGSDHLELIKSWPSQAPGKRVYGGVKIFGSALLQPARSVSASLSAFFIIIVTLLIYVTMMFYAVMIVHIVSVMSTKLKLTRCIVIYVIA